jgi:hypothetical protein
MSQTRAVVPSDNTISSDLLNISYSSAFFAYCVCVLGACAGKLGADFIGSAALFYGVDLDAFLQGTDF